MSSKPQSNLRVPKDVSIDFYQTNPQLVTILIKIYKRFYKPGYTSIDPSVGRGVIFKRLQSPKSGCDITDKFLTNTNNYTVTDFLKTNYNTDPKRTIVVGNPPFRSSKRVQLYVDFVNHASRFANTVIFILPLTAMRKRNILQVHNLSLTHVYHLPSGVQYFETLDGLNRSVGVCIHVYQKTSTPSFAKVSKYSGDKEFSFTTHLYKHPPNYCDFFVKTLDSPKAVGQISISFPYTKQYLKEHPRANCWLGVKVLTAKRKKTILSRFREMYENHEILDYKHNTSTGNWSHLYVHEIIQIFYKLVDKPNFKVRSINT